MSEALRETSICVYGEREVAASFVGNSPHGPATTSTIARWIKQPIVARLVLKPQFCMHSTRVASSTAAAMNGIAIREMMERAGLSKWDTFVRAGISGR